MNQFDFTFLTSFIEGLNRVIHTYIYVMQNFATSMNFRIEFNSNLLCVIILNIKKVYFAHVHSAHGSR